MAASRLIYLAALLGCGIFYIAYGEWFSWLLLWAVIGFPWLSLLLSLGTILRFRAAAAGPDRVNMGCGTELWLVGSCDLPMPPFRGQLKLYNHFTGTTSRYHGDKGLPADHCGAYTVTIDRLRVFDYLGIFSFPVRKTEAKQIYIRPIPVPVKDLPDLHRSISRIWRPKPGGGFSEHHELRLYRPGDSLNQIHWKLSAKTGKRILREAMEPQRGLVLLTMNLRGTPDSLDRKLGRFHWLGFHILKQEIPFTLRVLTGEGVLSFSIQTEPELEKALDALLCCPTVSQGDIREQQHSAAWHYHIGGQRHGE